MDLTENKVFNLIKENIPDKDIKILELTPGEGNLTRALINDGYHNIQALDIDPDNFKVKDVVCHQGNLNDPFPFDSDSFDLVISVEGIEHLENQYQFASEINRVLKDNAYAIITTPNINNFASRIRYLFTGFYALAERPSSEFEKNWFVEHIYPLTFWQLRHILHTSGLFIQKIETNRIRKSSLIGILFYPFSYFLTWSELKSEPHEGQRKVNMEILKQMHTPALYLGRSQIIFAQKQKHSYVKNT
jgi:2-polyprenyl-3-methyl-5-hydroxy-6-metoxy-1,4-benzoquinol methylase